MASPNGPGGAVQVLARRINNQLDLIGGHEDFPPILEGVTHDVPLSGHPPK